MAIATQLRPTTMPKASTSVPGTRPWNQRIESVNAHQARIATKPQNEPTVRTQAYSSSVGTATVSSSMRTPRHAVDGRWGISIIRGWESVVATRTQQLSHVDNAE